MMEKMAKLSEQLKEKEMELKLNLGMHETNSEKNKRDVEFKNKEIKELKLMVEEYETNLHETRLKC